MGDIIDLKGYKANKGQEYDAMINAAKALNAVLVRWGVNLNCNGKSTDPGMALSIAWVAYCSNDTTGYQAILDETVSRIMKACTLSGKPSLFGNYLDAVVAYIKSRIKT